MNAAVLTRSLLIGTGIHDGRQPTTSWMPVLSHKCSCRNSCLCSGQDFDGKPCGCPPGCTCRACR